MAWKGNARLNARRDANERPIIQALEAQGFHVVQINGTGVPDLLVSKRGMSEPLYVLESGRVTRPLPRHQNIGRCWLVEVKTPKGKYKSSQIKFRESWQGPPIITLRSVDDALKFQLLVCEVGG